MILKEISKSIDFLLENAGPVIQYRLRKEILKNLTVDEEEKLLQQICLKGFKRVLEISSLEEITKFDANAKRKYNYPYIEADEYFPDSYTLAMLAYTKSWRTEENVKMLGEALNHINAIMKPDNDMHIRIKGKYVGPCFALVRPIQPFRSDVIGSVLYRRPITEIAMLGVGDSVNVIKESVANVEAALDKEGILRMDFGVPHNKRYSPKKIEYPEPYNDVRLEENYKSETALLCDLTFWAVQFLCLVKGSCFNK